MAKELSRKELLLELFAHAGWRIFEEDLIEIQQALKINTELMLDDFVGLDGSAKLNFVAGKNRGYKEVLGIVESLKEEAQEN